METACIIQKDRRKREGKKRVRGEQQCVVCIRAVLGVSKNCNFSAET